MHNIATAKQDFSQLVHAAAREPQIISNRGKPVAAIVSYELLARLKQEKKPSITEQLEPLRQAFLAENYELIIPPRSTRHNAFLDVLNDLD